MDAVRFIEERNRMCKSFGDRCTGGSFLYGTDTHGWPIAGDAVLMKEGYNSDGELDILGLDEQDIKYLRDMVSTKMGREVKLGQEVE